MRKEILGWLFDGIARTMHSPNEKILKTKAEIKQQVLRGVVSSKEMERPNGNLWHAALMVAYASSHFASINNVL